MTDKPPIACSLGADGLQRRLGAIAAIGADSLISRELVGGRHRLRFRGGAETEALLAEIVAAEEACCPFLDLSLAEEAGEVILTIGAAAEGRAVAHQLAAAFDPPPASD